MACRTASRRTRPRLRPRGERALPAPTPGPLQRVRSAGRRLQRQLPDVLRPDHDRALAGAGRLSGDGRRGRRHGRRRGADPLPLGAPLRRRVRGAGRDRQPGRHLDERRDPARPATASRSPRASSATCSSNPAAELQRLSRNRFAPGSPAIRWRKAPSARLWAWVGDRGREDVRVAERRRAVGRRRRRIARRAVDRRLPERVDRRADFGVPSVVEHRRPLRRWSRRPCCSRR